MKTFATVVSIALLGSTPSALAATYEVAVTRKAGNLYRVDGKNILIHTRHCYVYAYSEEAFLKSNGPGGELIFVDSRDKCDIKAVFAKSEPKPGKYTVRVSHESADWYSIDGTSLYLQTSICLSLALSEEAFLTIRGGGIGRIAFRDGQSCMVESVFAKTRLD